MCLWYIYDQRPRRDEVVAVDIPGLARLEIPDWSTYPATVNALMVSTPLRVRRLRLPSLVTSSAGRRRRVVGASQTATARANAWLRAYCRANSLFPHPLRDPTTVVCCRRACECHVFPHRENSLIRAAAWPLEQLLKDHIGACACGIYTTNAREEMRSSRSISLG